MRGTAYLAVAIILFSPAVWAQPPFVPQAPEVETLPQGTALFFLEDHELPTFELIVFLPGGSVWDPRGREGRATLAIQAIRQGGSLRRSPQEVEEALDFLGASLEAGHDEELAYLRLRCLKDDWREVVALLFELLKTPAFDPRQVDILKDRLKESIQREEEDPMRLAMRLFPRLVYGKKSPWGRHPTARSVGRVERRDLIDYYEAFVIPHRMVLGATGDINRLDFGRTVKMALVDWEVDPEPLPSIPPLRKVFAEGASFFPVKGLSQATIITGHLGEKRTHPDKYALLAMNYLLGGSGALSSRLGERIRTDAGKAYTVWSHYGFGREPGLFYAATQTVSAETPPVLREIQEVIREAALKPSFSGVETDRAKTAILRALLFEYETRFSLVRDLAKFHLWGYPPNYLLLFQEKVGALTPDELDRVAREHLRPEGLQTLVVGDPTVLEKLRGIDRFKKVRR